LTPVSPREPITIASAPSFSASARIARAVVVVCEQVSGSAFNPRSLASSTPSAAVLCAPLALASSIPFESGIDGTIPNPTLELVAVIGEQLGDVGLKLVDDPPDLLVHEPLHLRRGLAGAGKQRTGSVGRQHGDRADLVAHPPAAHHLTRDLGELLEVRLRAR